MNQHSIESLIALAERKQRKVEQLVALLRDPDLADIVGVLTDGSSNGIPAPRPTSLPAVTQGSLRQAIRSLYNFLPEKFTVFDVFERLSRQGYEFGKRDPKDALRDQLYQLSHELRELTIVGEGKGGKPNIYQLAQKLTQK